MNEHHGATRGGKQPRLYRIWRQMRARCHDPKCDGYARYGAKGITVCDEWRDSFTAFRRWAEANGYRDDLSIDRVDGSKNYEPANCRWATVKQQARNRTGPAINHLMVEHAGRLQNLFAWSRETKIGYTTLVKRYKAGLRSPELFNPARVRLQQYRGARAQTGNGRAKLTAELVAAVRASKEAGRALAMRLGVSEALISMIRSGARR